MNENERLAAKIERCEALVEQERSRADRLAEENERLAEDFRDAHRAVTEWMEKYSAAEAREKRLREALVACHKHLTADIRGPAGDAKFAEIAARALAELEGKNA